ncbi:MAG: hypothetical protein IPO67_15105 [Deltaproteobacteria bacterium]|nr:hypothetical protein [Deltaproteobacteria bacterium]
MRKLNLNAKIVLGGPHCTMFPDYAIQLSGADAIINGDGEDAFVEMAEAHNRGRDFEGIEGCGSGPKDGQIVKNKDRKSTKSSTLTLARLLAHPLPRLLPPRHQAALTTTAITSRGCPHSCPFCLTYKKQYRVRDIENILDEMEHCNSLGITEVHFIDDIFTPNSQWVLVLRRRRAPR